MRTFPAFRVGRRVYHDEYGGGQSSCKSCIATVFIVLIVAVGIPACLIAAELTYRNLLESFGEVEGMLVAIENAAENDVVHFQSSSVDANVSDTAFGVNLNGALRLRRNTEYCQWEESSKQKRDENNRTYTQYYYVKSWRNRRIHSVVFDQPGAHFNPQRDPFPSATFTAERPVLRMNNDVAILDRKLVETTRAPWTSVDWTLGGVQQQRRWWWRSSARYEDISGLQGVQSSQAATWSKFAYVGQGGYFFSPYQVQTSHIMFKLFAQYLEGSLLDWQLGDLMPSCTAGDIRVWFSVQDPSEVSVVGKVGRTTVGDTSSSLHGQEGDKVWTVGLHRTPKGHDIGMVHSGFKSSKEMMVTEARWQLFYCVMARAALLIPAGVFASTLMDWRAGAVLWSACIGCLWIFLWGVRSSGAQLVLAGSCCMLVWILSGRGKNFGKTHSG